MIGLFPKEPQVRWDHTDVNALLLWGSDYGMTDTKLYSSSRAWMKVDKVWVPVTERPVTADELLAGLERMTKNNAVSAMLKSSQQDYDFIHMVEYARGKRLRYRGNAAPVVDGYSTGVRIVLRSIASEPRKIAELNLEPAILEHLFPKTGLVLITGVMGSGKTTLLAAAIREIIEKGGRSVITFEQPAEYDFSLIPNPRGPVSQSMIPDHFKDFMLAVRSSTRAAPDVVMVGESRDRDTLHGLITSAETGVAAYSTAHTSTVPATITRILNVFPHEERSQVAAALISGLRLIISQRLIPHPSGTGVTALREFLPFTAEIRETLLDTPTERLISKTEELLLEQGQTIQQAAERAFNEGTIDKEWLTAINAERREKKAENAESKSQHTMMLELLSMGKELLHTLNKVHQRRSDNGRGSFMAGYRAGAQDFHFGRARRVSPGALDVPLGLVDGGHSHLLHSNPVSGAAHRHVAFGLRPRHPRGAARQTPGNAVQRTTVAQTLPLVNPGGENMNTPVRNSNNLYDAPNLHAVRESIALTQADLMRQLEDGAFEMDRVEAIRCGLINPYDDDTARVLVQ